MSIWSATKRAGEALPPVSSVAHGGIRGVSRDELARAAVRALAAGGHADRIGVWLAPEPAASDPARFAFRGCVWERGSMNTPAEWTRLSPESPLPQTLLCAGISVEQDLQQVRHGALLGVLVGLRTALWTPVDSGGRLQGLLLAGAVRRSASLPRARLEEVAAELVLALDLADEKRIASNLEADLHLARRTLAEIQKGEPAGALLQRLIDSQSVGAAFLALGEISSSGSPTDPPVFSWSSGDAGLLHVVSAGPIAAIWKRALDSAAAAGEDVHVRWAQEEMARVLAVPVQVHGEYLGVLVAGYPLGSATLATLERLELRASLAAFVLRQRRQQEREQAALDAAARVLASSADAILLLDSRGTVTMASPAAVDLASGALAGRTGDASSAVVLPAAPAPESLSGTDFSALFHARDRREVSSWWQRTLIPKLSAPETSLTAELRTGQTVRLRGPWPAGVNQFGVLLESAGESAASPAREPAQLQAVLEWIDQGVLIFDPQERVQEMNMRFAQIAGLSPEEGAQPASLESLILRLAGQTADPPAFAERWRRLARGDAGGSRDELQLLRPAPRVLERAARPIFDAAGRRVGRLEIYRDLTAPRVFQSRLLQTEKLAALGQMVTGVAHELSNPLTTILGYAQRLLLRNDEESGRSSEARKIFQEAERATVILRQLLLHARETRPERRPVSLNHLVMRALELQRFGLTAEKIQIALDLDPVLSMVHGDAGQLQQVLMNLLGNARQAIEEKGRGGTILIRTRLASERRVTLEVKDDGPGIPEGIRARIFDPFFTTKPAGVGTGLGLGIVLSIVREHGGHISVDSTPGAGASFLIELPAGVSESLLTSAPAAELRPTLVRRESPSAKAPEPAREKTPHRSARVLVVEDEPTVARLIADVLEDEGHVVEVLLDGREALVRASLRHFDLVICDMKMPGLDGQQFFKTLQRSSPLLHRKFLFVTGDVLSATTRDFLERYCLAHVAKPFRVEELTDQVRGMLGAMHQEPQEPAAKTNQAKNG